MDPTPLLAHFNARTFALHGLCTAVLCCLIALTLQATGQGAWDAQLVYSLAVGLISWLVIDLGRLLLTRHQAIPWPAGWRGPLLVSAGIAAGALLGGAIGRLYRGDDQPFSLGQALTSPAGLTTLALTAAISIAMCLVLYHRGKAQELQRAIVQSQRDTAEARLKLLEAQLEPHMVFNTLANLRVLIASDTPRAEAMLDHFIAYLRATLAGARTPQHALEAEFARLGDYLELMAVRMGARLRYQLELPAELAGAAVPSLLLQPLVENAIRHGLEPQIAGGEIVVRAQATRQGQLLLEVLDNGAGLGEEPPEARTLEGARHFGLTQVRERLLTLHGSQATLTLEARAEGGTRCSVSLPLLC
ncbi:sensor histidine kinase [Pantoea sp. 18069]|uniref:sensor histidine kinase n=1 Tax=Pantoea sp. 18069 TaxID=2681415 RepID=UPI00190F9372|nr:histidine kinase [Pantoea sp. 18069]